MCSVLRCESGSRGAQRFKLPEDPERRLEWVQFIFEVNGQRLKESSWTDIAICNEHFTGDCFEHVTPVTGVLWVQLKPDAVPSVCVQSEHGEHLERLQCAEPVETTETARQCDDLNSPTSSENTRHSLTSLHSANAVMLGSDLVQQKPMNIDLDKEKAALLQMKGKHVMNESCLFQLFRRKCPSCGCELQMEKVTRGLLIVLNQQCLQCDYRNQWKSQVNASVPTAEDQHLTEVEGVTPEIQQDMSPDDNPSSTAFSEIVTFSDEESDPSDEGEDGEDGGVSSDGEWNPTDDFLLAEELTKESDDEETEDEGEEEEEFDSPGGLKITELCTECGGFFTLLKRHTCEHKIKPHSCNICGKRCVTETSLENHSRIHDETYDHPCKYCYVTFKTRADKLKHEQTHHDNRDPYKCPDCPETFTTSRKRRIHLANHRTPKEYKCGVCGIEFKDVHHLRRHSVVHTGLKPYQCSVCQRGFNQTSHLKSHMRLHTGERPFKCPQCDKSFNHNVSLKSHVQRHHSSASGRRQKKGKRDERASDERASDAGDAEDSGSKKGTGREFDCAEEERDAGEEAQKERTDVRKSRKRKTGRPRGRPKRNAAGSLAPAGQKQGQRSNTKTAKSKARKKTGSGDEESEDEQSDSDTSFKSAEEEEEEGEKKKERVSVRKSTARLRRRPKNDSDTDFDPEEEEAKKKRSSSLSNTKSSVKCTGRPAKNLVV